MRYEISGVSIVIPARNEGASIGRVLQECCFICKEMGRPYEIIVVDDHSIDLTGEVAKEYGCRVIRNEGLGGKGNALLTGFQQARYNVIAMMDADYSHRPLDLPKFLGSIEDGLGIVVGDRMTGGSDEYTLLRSLGNRFLTWVFRNLFGVQILDALNGYKAFRREVFDAFQYTSSGFEIEIELLANARRLGYSIGMVSSQERGRLEGRPKSFVLRDGIRFLSRIFQERFTHRTPRALAADVRR